MKLLEFWHLIHCHWTSTSHVSWLQQVAHPCLAASWLHWCMRCPQGSQQPSQIFFCHWHIKTSSTHLCDELSFSKKHWVLTEMQDPKVSWTHPICCCCAQPLLWCLLPPTSSLDAWMLISTSQWTMLKSWEQGKLIHPPTHSTLVARQRMIRWSGSSEVRHPHTCHPGNPSPVHGQSSHHHIPFQWWAGNNTTITMEDMPADQHMLSDDNINVCVCSASSNPTQPKPTWPNTIQSNPPPRQSHHEVHTLPPSLNTKKPLHKLSLISHSLHADSLVWLVVVFPTTFHSLCLVDCCFSCHASSSASTGSVSSSVWLIVVVPTAFHCLFGWLIDCGFSHRVSLSVEVDTCDFKRRRGAKSSCCLHQWWFQRVIKLLTWLLAISVQTSSREQHKSTQHSMHTQPNSDFRLCMAMQSLLYSTAIKPHTGSTIHHWHTSKKHKSKRPSCMHTIHPDLELPIFIILSSSSTGSVSSSLLWLIVVFLAALQGMECLFKQCPWSGQLLKACWTHKVHNMPKRQATVISCDFALVQWGVWLKRLGGTTTTVVMGGVNSTMPMPALQCLLLHKTVTSHKSGNKGWTSADRSTKATLMLTVPRSIQVVYKGFNSTNIK